MVAVAVEGVVRQPRVADRHSGAAAHAKGGVMACIKVKHPRRQRRSDRALAALFDQLNRKWFDGRLRPCAVKWASMRSLGYYKSSRRTIYLQRGLADAALIGTLLHEICHIGTPYHGPKFKAKIERLKRIGAPIALCVANY